MKIRIFSDNVSFKCKIKRKIEYLLKSIAYDKNKIIENVNYVFVSEKAIIEINKKFLKHNYCTDIITFDNSEKIDTISGEMYISVETVKKNAKFYKVEFEEELIRVIVHGFLHLCGYNDQTAADIEKMRTIEDYYIKHYYAISSI